MIVSYPLDKSATFGTAQCSNTDAVGDIVYVSGPKVGPDLTVTKVDRSNVNKMPGIGIILTKITPTRAIIQFNGDVQGVYTGLTPGKLYFIDSNSKPVAAPITAVGKAYIQSIGVAVSTDVLRLTFTLPAIGINT